MDKEIKAKWIEALQSGKYEQGNGNLHTKYDSSGRDLYCCLGVLAEVCNLTQRKSDENSNRYGFEFGTAGHLDFTYPPDGWQDLGRKNIRTLATMNDMENKTFAEIADWVEENI